MLPLRASRRQAVSTSSTGPPPNPRIRLLSVTHIAPCASISVRKCEHLRFSTLLLTAFARVHTAFYATSGIGSQAALTPDDFRYESPMLNKISCNAYGKSAHTLSLQSSGASFPFPTSPMLCRSAPRSSAGCAYPKSSTMLIARHACHRPSNTRPHRLKAEAKVCCRNRKCLSAHRLTLAR